jgi:ABC-type branched-subunit amino acid transport system substrate-binding protein
VESRRNWLPARRVRVASLATIVAAAITVTACSSSGSTSSSASGGSTSAGSGGSSSSSSSATKSPIDVGLVTSLTSSSLAPYPQVAAAQKASIAYINSTGGINGHPLVANQCDDQDQPNVAATCAAAAVRSNDVAIVGGTEVFPGFFSTINTAKLTFTGGLGLIPQELTSPVSFPVTSVAAGWYFGSGALAVKLGAKAVTIVQCSIPACEGTAQESAAALKIAGDNVAPKFVTFQLGQAISATDAQQVITQKPDAVLIAAPGPYPQQMMTALRQAGYTGKIINNIGSFGPQAIKTVGNSIADGTYVVSTLRLPTETSIPAVALYNTWMNKTDASAQKDELSLLEWTAMLDFADIAKTLPAVTRASVLNAYQNLKTPIDVGTSAPFSVVGSPSPLSTAPQLHSADVMYSEIENGQYKPIGTFVNPFTPAGS